MKKAYSSLALALMMVPTVVRAGWNCSATCEFHSEYAGMKGFVESVHLQNGANLFKYRQPVTSSGGTREFAFESLFNTCMDTAASQSRNLLTETVYSPKVLNSQTFAPASAQSDCKETSDSRSVQLMRAILNGDQGSVSMLLAPSANENELDPNEFVSIPGLIFSTPISEAVRLGQKQTVTKLVELSKRSGKKIITGGIYGVETPRDPLSAAIEQNQFEIFKFFVETAPLADLDWNRFYNYAPGGTYLEQAIRNYVFGIPNLNLVMYIINHPGVNIDLPLDSPLLNPLQQMIQDSMFNTERMAKNWEVRQAEVIGILKNAPRPIGQGINWNRTDDEGNSAILNAAAFGYLEAVKALFEAGADWKVKNKMGQDIFECAVQTFEDNLQGNADVLKFLLEKGPLSKARVEELLTFAMGKTGVWVKVNPLVIGVLKEELKKF